MYGRESTPLRCRIAESETSDGVLSMACVIGAFASQQ